MKRILVIFCGSFLLCLFGVCLFLLTTESGLVLVQKSVNRLAGKTMSIGQVRGRLLGEFSLHDIRLPGRAANIDVENLELSWNPGRLLLGELHLAKLELSGVAVTLKNRPEAGPAAHPGDQVAASVRELPAKLPPITILLKSFVVKNLKIADSDGTELLVVDRLSGDLEGNKDRLSIRDVTLQGPKIGLNMHGNIEVNNNWSLDVLGSWRLAGFGFHSMAGSFSASGPLEHPHLELGIRTPGTIQISADFVDLLQEPEWKAEVRATDVDLSTLIEDCPKIDLATVTGNLTGNFKRYGGHVEAEGSWDTIKRMHLVSDITGDFLRIDFQSLRIATGESSAEVEGGQISWRDIFSWKGRFRFKNFDPSVISKELQGRLTAELESVGDVKEHGVVASFKIFSLHGMLRDHKVSAKGNVFLTEADVRTDGLIVRSGEVAGLAYIEKGFFSWTGKPTWSGIIRLEKFDPSWLYPEFPGSINGLLEGEGKLGDNGLEGSLDIKSISGTFRGNKLSGGGEIKLSGDTFKTTELVLQSGKTKLVVGGRAGKSLAIDFSLNSPNIGSILPEGKGSIHLRGSLIGNRNEPQLEAELQGTDISYRENSVLRLQTQFHAGLTKDGQLSGSFLGEKMHLAGYRIDRGRIELTGSLANHQIVVRGSGAMGKLSFAAQGSYRDKWQGTLSAFRLDFLNYGIWQQKNRATLTAGRESARLDKFCLTDQKSTVCLGGEVQFDKDQSWKVHGNLASVPLKWLNRLKLIALPVNGLLDADIALNGDKNRILSGKLQSTISGADAWVSAQDTEPVPLRFTTSKLTLELSKAVLQSNVNINMLNGSQIALVAEVDGIGDFSTPLLSLPLHGNLELKDFDLATLRKFTGYGVEPSGRVSSVFNLAGTVGQPEVYGNLSLEEGGVNLPYQGITLKNIQLSIEAGGEEAQIKATASSGPGKVSAVGTVKYGSEGIEGRINVQGKDFLAVNLPEYAIRVNPDVVFTFSKEKGELQGTIDIPYALLTPEEMSNSISASEDVVFVNETSAEPISGWPFHLDIKVRLGDDVRIDGYGLTGKLVGALKVTTTPGGSLAGRGELDLVEGKFTLYGRSLNIKRGRVLFTGGPIDNPGVDVRAQIKVSAEEARGEGYTVGVDISGLVQDLQYHLFSDPYMDDTEILSLMIVGHSLANSTKSEGNMLEAAAVMLGVKGSSSFVQGIGNFLQLDELHLEGSTTKEDVSLVLGKHLTKHLYVGYDLNMFNQLGQFRVRYDLKRGFSVETTSSSESTGADLLYTFER